MKIFLVGLPGSGKSTLGRALADLLRLPFVDLDAVIEGETGKTVQLIFSEKGEAYFRDVEASTLRRISGSHQAFVMATGGGAPCFHDNMKYILQEGISIFLDVPVDEILERLEGTDTTMRPLFGAVSSQEIRARLERLWELRRPVYLQASITASGNQLNAMSLAQRLEHEKL
ncbi:MAG: shikimate kinase [Cyclobacteriaceae bacterium]|nr:shikimate kinase [Cyclobacteriaceae bacterium]